MLRHGHHPLKVADATGVPLALVELIHAEHHPHPVNPAPTPPAGDTAPVLDQLSSAPDPGAVSDVDLVGQVPNYGPVAADLDRRRTELVWSRWRARNRCAAILALVGNVALATAADITHLFALVIAAVMLTPLLVVLLWWCAARGAGRGGSPVRKRHPR